MFLYFLF